MNSYRWGRKDTGGKFCFTEISFYVLGCSCCNIASIAMSDKKCTLSTGSYSFINLIFVVIILLYFRLGFISSWKRLEVTRVQKLLKEEESGPWGRNIQAKLGSRLIELLIETAFVHSPVNQSADTPPDIRPAFSHRFKAISKNPE
ncbi:hypothetical protein JHK85_005090 [Glycine max]|nr:hypothetical protein JHK85_005090 [Glycine max]